MVDFPHRLQVYWGSFICFDMIPPWRLLTETINILIATKRKGKNLFYFCLAHTSDNWYGSRKNSNKRLKCLFETFV